MMIEFVIIQTKVVWPRSRSLEKKKILWISKIHAVYKVNIEYEMKTYFTTNMFDLRVME